GVMNIWPHSSRAACAVIYLPLELRDFLCHETDPLDHLPALYNIRACRYESWVSLKRKVITKCHIMEGCVEQHTEPHEKYDYMATVAWPRQEQPCPIAGDFCMNGGTCLFFETVGEPACKEKRKEYKRRENVLLTLMSLLESTREIELTFLVTPLCAATDELAVSGVERSFTKCLLSIARVVELEWKLEWKQLQAFMRRKLCKM
ncbi:hypothetical protein G5I_12001, partial [Acromyrmex echinatior]